MLRLFLIISSFAFIFSSCHNPENNSMRTGTITGPNIDTISGYANVNGLKMYYEIHGSGDPLVLIHGGGSSIQTTFGKVLPLFVKRHKVIAVELQAHGRTADIDRPLSFEQDADDIAELLKHLGIPKSDIFGFSNGASTTLQMAIRHPELVNKIIVASTFFKKDGAQPWLWKMMANPSFEGMPQQFKDAFLEVNPDTNALYRMYERDVARMQKFPEIKEDSIGLINAPTFIILGDKDVVTPEHAVEMHRLISNSRLAILPGGHGGYIGEITTPYDSTLVAATVGIIEKFLNETRMEEIQPSKTH
jgi:pimeloyl-ACP methyl ester carboxylesterase